MRQFKGLDQSSIRYSSLPVLRHKAQTRVTIIADSLKRSDKTRIVATHEIFCACQLMTDNSEPCDHEP